MTGRLVVRGGTVGGEISVPGDKSISHRAAMFAAMADGRSELHGFLNSADCLATLRALESLGAGVEIPDSGPVIIEGCGGRGFATPEGPLDFGNSGTGLRLMAGILCGRGIHAVLTGDASLRSRPMTRIVGPLRAMGAEIQDKNGTPPLILGGGALCGREHILEVASAQVKSCLLLAGLHAEGTSWIRELVPTRDHTERMMVHFGVPLVRQGPELGVQQCRWELIAGRNVSIPGDISSAAFFAVAAAITPGARLRIRNVGLNPGRTGFLTILERFGADVVVVPRPSPDPEPVGDILIHGGDLRAVTIQAHEIPGLIDELPALLIAAALAQGRTTVRGARELRFKESDRLRAMASGLMALGISVNEQDDGIEVQGGTLKGGTVDAVHDHRIAMAFAVAGARARGPVEIENCDEIATSFPGFIATAEGAGLGVMTA